MSLTSGNKLPSSSCGQIFLYKLFITCKPSNYKNKISRRCKGGPHESNSQSPVHRLKSEHTKWATSRFKRGKPEKFSGLYFCAISHTGPSKVFFQSCCLRQNLFISLSVWCNYYTAVCNIEACNITISLFTWTGSRWLWTKDSLLLQTGSEVNELTASFSADTTFQLHRICSVQLLHETYNLSERKVICNYCVSEW